jgi:general secretion pathway protein C
VWIIYSATNESGFGYNKLREKSVSAGGQFHFEPMESVLRWRATPWVVNAAVALFVVLSLWQSVARMSDQPSSASWPERPVVAGSAEQDLGIVLAASLFGETNADSAMAPAPEIAPLTSLNLVLKGVVAIKDAGMAFIGVQGRPEELYVIGQEVSSGAILSAVYPDRILLRRGSQFESLMLEGADMKGIHIVAANRPMAPSPASPGRGSAEKPYLVLRASLRAEVQSPQELLSQAVLVPNAGGGFLLKEIQSESVIEEFGLRAGDVIHAINGQTLHYADDIRRAYEQLGSATQVKVELWRDGKKEVFHYRVEEGTKTAAPPHRRRRHGDAGSGGSVQEPMPLESVQPEPPLSGGDGGGGEVKIAVS